MAVSLTFTIESDSDSKIDSNNTAVRYATNISTSCTFAIGSDSELEYTH